MISTCLTSRAVHLEICSDVSTAATKFCPCRQRITTHLQEFTTSGLPGKQGNHFKFIPTHAHHSGGIWERFIRSCTAALYSVIGSETLTDDIFATTLNKIEAVLNNRLIIEVRTDINDTDAPTPNQFCSGEHTSM